MFFSPKIEHDLYTDGEENVNFLFYFLFEKIGLTQGTIAMANTPPLDDEILYFHGKRGRPVPVDHAAFAHCLARVGECQAAQFIQRGEEALEIRYRIAPGADRESVGNALRDEIVRGFAAFGAGNAVVSLSDEPLIADEDGAFRIAFREYPLKENHGNV